MYTYMHAKLYNTMHGWWELHHIRDVTFVLIAITWILNETLQYYLHSGFETVTFDYITRRTLQYKT